MRKSVIFILLAMASAPAFAKHHKHWHTDGVAAFGDNCEVLICMTGKVQGDTQAGCQTVNQRYFNVRVFTPYYNAEATSSLRESLLNTCSGIASNEQNVKAITQEFGRLPNG